MEVGEAYLNVVINRFKSVKKLGDQTLDQLSEEEMHWKYNNESNSAAVIVKHMSGNMVSRWSDFFTSDGEKENRNRDEEFTEDERLKSDVIASWEKGWIVLLGTLSDLTQEDLLKTIDIRGESHLVLEAIERQLAHYAYHVGQIVFIGKQVRGREWKSLSIPKGQSEEYLKQMLEKHKDQ